MEKPSQSVVKLEDIDFNLQNSAENHPHSIQRNQEEESKAEDPLSTEMQLIKKANDLLTDLVKKPRTSRAATDTII